MNESEENYKDLPQSNVNQFPAMAAKGREKFKCIQHHTPNRVTQIALMKTEQVAYPPNCRVILELAKIKIKAAVIK